MRTPLHDEHLRLGAKITEFAGWEMPLYYSSIVREVGAVRSAVGIFDLSHMGELMISGPKALDLVQLVTTNDASTLTVGDAQYSLMCDENGGIIDDLIVYRLDTHSYMLVVNAGNTHSDFQWAQEHNLAGALCENHTDKVGLVAVQGPASQGVLQPLTDLDLTALRRFTVKRGRVGDVDAWIARTGYTGEDGFELYCSSLDSLSLWRLVLEAGRAFGAEPTGLGARDVLRIEAGYPLYGHELTRTRSPVDARLLWVVKLAKGEFLGRQAISQAKERGPKQLLVGLMAEERCIPRRGHEVGVNGTHVGRVTSGTFSPTLGKGIAMAYIEPEYEEDGTEVSVEIRGKSCVCRVVPIPFLSFPARCAGQDQTDERSYK